MKTCSILFLLKDKYMGVIRYGCRFLTGLVSFILLSVSGASAQGGVWGPGGGGGGGAASTCLLNSTGFETTEKLCDPQLPNDSTGWFSKKGADLSGCEMQMQASNAIQTGIPASISSSSAFFSKTLWADAKKQNTPLSNQSGLTAILKNPKTIDPILSEGNGTNMLVNSGTSGNNLSHFLSYSLSGLKPNSTVTMEFDVYYLIDQASAEIYVKNNNLNDYQPFGCAIHYNNGKWDPAFSTCSTQLDYATRSANDQFTDKKSITVKATTGAQSQKISASADEGGNITFYFMRSNSEHCTVPIGIDNIKVYADVQPSISYTGTACPEMPASLITRESYPAGTKYSWKVSSPDTTGTEESFVFYPHKENTDYTAQVQVTIPGCSTTDPVSTKIHVGTCCLSDDGAPAALANVYYNDFGYFSGKNYIYTDANGKEQSVAAPDVNTCAPYDGQPVTSDPRKDFTGVTYASNICSDGGKYAISTIDPYTGILRDHTGKKNGAFLMIDLDGNAGGSGWKNPVFEKEICGLCHDKMIRFNTAVSAINNAMGGATACDITISLVDKKTGNPLKLYDKNTGQPMKDCVWTHRSNTPGWKNFPDEADYELYLKEEDNIDCVLLRIEYNSNKAEKDEGDFALDDIFFQVCAPPAITIDYDVNGSHQVGDVLDLCQDVLRVKTNDKNGTLARYYGKDDVRYMFQYTDQNPNKTDPSKVIWRTMKDANGKEILKDSVYVIDDPQHHEAFEKFVQNPGLKDSVYFRILVGKEVTLGSSIEIEKAISENSPCRNISVQFLDIPAMLNCEACTKPDHVHIEADGKSKTTVELCKGESTILEVKNKNGKNQLHGIEVNTSKDYYEYEATWLKDGNPISGKFKATSETDPSTPTLEVTWDDVQAAGSAEYSMLIHDAYDPTLTSTYCDTTVTITVIAHPDPEAPTIDDIDLCEKVKPRKELKDRLKENDFSDFTVNWYDGANTQTASKVSEPDLDALTATSTFYYSVTDKNTLCEGKTKSFEVEVHSTSNPIGTREVSYLVKDTTASGVFKDLVTQDATVLDIESGYTYEWFDKNMHSLGNSAPTPDVPPLPLTEDEHVIYYVARKDNQYGCWSDTLDVKVTIFGVPAPNPEDVYYCVGSTRVVPLTATINTSGAATGVTFELVWYDPSKTLIGATAPTPSVAAEGETIYYVSQKSSDGAESSLQPLHVKVYKAHTLSPIAEDTYCDDNQNPSALVKFALDGPNEFERATDIQWTLNGDPWDSDKLPILGVKKDTTYVFKAVQSYTVTDNMGTELETCYSDTTPYTVKVFYTAPTGDSSVAYIAAELQGDGKFPPITEKEGWSEEPGYTYYYAEHGSTNFSKSVPRPNDVGNLNGGTKTIEYDVYRVADGKPLDCPSEVSSIYVTISDAMPPKVTDYHYCEGSALQPLTAEIQPITGKTKNDYELYWYESKPSSTTADPDEKGDTYTKISGTATVESDGTIKSTSYFVAQHDNTTGATSAAMEIHVVVYPKPKLTITDPAATCGSDNEFVDITTTWTANNTTETVTATYSADAPTSVSESGTYQISGTYDIPKRPYKGSNQVQVMDATCHGADFPVKVEVNYLTQPSIGDQTGVCPGKGIKLTASAESADPGTVTYQWSGYSTQTGSEATATGDMVTGTKHVFNVTATAGVCSYTTSGYEVTVGDGPVIGSILVNESDNSELPRTIDAFSGSLDSRTLYSCGGEVVVTSKLDKTEGDFEWYEGGNKIYTGDVLTIPATDQYSEKTYTIKYINECETQTTFKIVTVPLSVEYVGPDTTVVLCENEVFETKVKVKCQEVTPMIQWYRNTTPVGDKVVASTTNEINYGIERVVKMNDGRYNCVVTNRGCTAKVNADSLVVHPNVAATLAEGPHIVPRHDSKTLKVNITVPTDGHLSDIVWMRDGVEAQTGSSPEFTEMDVVSDHEYYVTLNDPEYCGTTAISTIWVEAEIQLKTSLKDTICMGESERLYIDTTGTGMFRNPYPANEYSIKVTQEMNGVTRDITGARLPDGDLLYIEVSPTSDATYTIEVSYDTQTPIVLTENVHVIPAISLDLPDPVTLCEGEQIDLTVQNVAPVGTTVSWYADETILSATADSLTVTVQPTYNAETGVNHESVYTYVAVAYNKTCQTFKNYNVPVNVDEPITGEMEGVAVICDGDESYVDAKKYAATTYLWTTSDGDTLGTGERIMPLHPNHSTIYYADMTRGKCTARESYTVEVKSLPVITSIDSVGYHSREVTLEAGAGNAPYMIWYDNIQSGVENTTHFDNIPFGTHTMHVKDFYNCETSMIFHLDPPEIIIPEYFTPNFDGTNDHWIIPGLAEVYPAAVVTIFDRYGKTLKQFFGAETDGWDGTYNGNKMPSTDYWYQIDIEEINRQYVGHFTLIRR